MTLMFLAGERRPWTTVESSHVAAVSTHFPSLLFRACPSSLRDIAPCHISLVLWQERGAARGEHGVRGPGAQRLSSIILTPPLQSQMLSGSLSRAVPEESPAGVSSTG